MQLQNIIFPAESFGYKEMYFRGGELKNNTLALKKGEQISFDTYFNSFSFTKYLDYTKAKNATFVSDFKGKATVQLCVYDGEKHVVSEISAENKVEVFIDFSNLPEKGFLYPVFIAETDCIISDFRYESDCIPRKINACVGICTYKREQYVKKNINAMRSFKFSFINRVFVSDNGNTLDYNALSDNFINICPNKNYGGSGGFTRCLIEAYDNDFSHIILMDDDVEFHCESLERMTTFISILRDECSENWFSAGMFPMDKPWNQFELGAEWDGKKAIVHKHNLDMLSLDNILDNLDNSCIGYGGWWTLCMPVSVVEKGLPYPFFIKFDDVEYGMRKSPEVDIITMNGVSVRHEAFDKKTSFVLDYYNLRNELVVNTIYGKYGVSGVIRRYWYEVCKQLFLYRYDNIPIVIRAIKDYLSGAEFFFRCDDEKVNSELINSVPKMHQLENLPGWEEGMRNDNHIKNKNVSVGMIMSLGGHLIPSFLLKKDITAYPLSRISAKDTYLKKTVIQYQLGGNTGIATNRSFGKFMKYLFKSMLILPQILFRYKKCKTNLMNQKHILVSMEFWRKKLGI